MAYRKQTSITRKTPLGPVRYNELLANQKANQGLLLQEHTSDGAHNSMRVPRAVAFVRYSGGAYSLNGASVGISSVASPGVGQARLTLDADYFPDDGGVSFGGENHIIPVATSAGPGATGPVLFGYKVNSETEVDIFQQQGAAWAAADLSFYLALHAQPYQQVNTLIATSPIVRDVGLSVAAWNALVANSANQRAIHLAEHTAAGAHNAREIPKASGKSRWTGAAYALTTHLGTITSTTKFAVGVVDVVLPAATYLNNPNPSVQIFARPEPGYGEQWNVLVEEGSLTNTGNYLTGFRVHIRKKSATNTWNLTDGSFFFNIHSA